MCSRGSVVTLFTAQFIMIITITDPSMTRFMMTLDDAVDLVLHAFQHGNSGDIFVQKSSAANKTLAHALLDLLDKPNHQINIIVHVMVRIV